MVFEEHAFLHPPAQITLVGGFCFDFKSGPLPSFEELTLHGAYDADEAHMELWRQNRSWSSLRSLDLGNISRSKIHLLKGLTGLIPQLKILRMVFQGLQLGPFDEASRDKYGINDFCQSIDALDEVSLKHLIRDAGAEAWPTILHYHGRSLRKLTKFKKGACDNPGMAIDQLEQLVAKAPNLGELAIEIALIQDPEADNVRYIWVI